MNLTKSDYQNLCEFYTQNIAQSEDQLAEAGKSIPSRPIVSGDNEASADALEAHMKRLDGIGLGKTTPVASARTAAVASGMTHTGRRLASAADSQLMAAEDQSADAKAIAAADRYDAAPGVRIIQPIKLSLEQRCIRAAGCTNYAELHAKKHEEGLARLEKARIPRRVLSGQK